MLANTDQARSAYRNIWVIAETAGSKVQKVTYELWEQGGVLQTQEFRAVVCGFGQ